MGTDVQHAQQKELFELYYRHGLAQLSEQYQRGRGLDARAGTVAAVASALVGVAAIVLKDFTGPTAPGKVSIIVASMIALSFLGSMGYCLRAISPRKAWYFDPPLDEFVEGFDKYPKTNPTRWTGNQIRNSVRKNELAINHKAKALSRAVTCLIVMGMLTVALGVAVKFAV